MCLKHMARLVAALLAVVAPVSPGAGMRLKGADNTADVADADTSQKDLLIIVRTHAPMAGMRERIQNYADMVRSNFPNAHFLVSSDDSNFTETTRARIDLPGENLHRFNWDDVQANYKLDIAFGHAHSWMHVDGRFFHMEPVLMAYEHAKKTVNLSPNATVWAIEDDVFICHNGFRGLIEQYRNVTADLITQPYWPLMKTMLFPLSGWASKPFLRKYPQIKRKVSSEAVQRFSARFLEHVQYLARDERFTAESEMFAPTVCFNDDKFKCVELSENHYGQYAARNGNEEAVHTTESQKEADRVCAVDKNNTMLLNTINHPAKF